MNHKTPGDLHATQTHGDEDATFRGIYFIEGVQGHTNPRRTWSQADAELKDYARRMPWLNASHVERVL